MAEIGTVPVPITIALLSAFDHIGETFMIADTSYNITWMNSEACRLLTEVSPLYGINNREEIIGMNMDYFHKVPEHRRAWMN